MSMTFGTFATWMFVLSVLAYLNPDIGKSGGILRPEITSTYIATALAFLVTGVTLSLQGYYKVLRNWHVLVLTQGFAFIMFPCIMMAFIYVLKQYPVHQSVIVGLQILSTLPPSVSTASHLTKQVGGNVAMSATNSVFGVILGFFLTPVFIEWLDHSEGHVPHLKIRQYLLLIALLPFIAGQIVQKKYKWLPHDSAVNTFGQILVLYAFYARLCNAFSKAHLYHAVDRFTLIMTIVMMICFHMVMKLVLLVSSHHLFHYNPKDCVAMMFVASHKNTSLGMYIIATIFRDYAEASGSYLPLLIYNPTQILIGGLSVKVVKQWLAGQRRRRIRNQLSARLQKSPGCSLFTRPIPKEEVRPSEGSWAHIPAQAM